MENYRARKYTRKNIYKIKEIINRKESQNIFDIKFVKKDIVFKYCSNYTEEQEIYDFYMNSILIGKACITTYGSCNSAFWFFDFGYDRIEEELFHKFVYKACDKIKKEEMDYKEKCKREERKQKVKNITKRYIKIRKLFNNKGGLNVLYKNI